MNYCSMSTCTRGKRWNMFVGTSGFEEDHRCPLRTTTEKQGDTETPLFSNFLVCKNKSIWVSWVGRHGQRRGRNGADEMTIHSIACNRNVLIWLFSKNSNGNRTRIQLIQDRNTFGQGIVLLIETILSSVIIKWKHLMHETVNYCSDQKATDA